MHRLVGVNSLRFFAIVLIVVYHLFRNFLPGGFIAVDIFFAISGFLIIDKLFRESKRGKIHYCRFVGSRLLRIFPSLLACVLLTLVIALFVHTDVLAGMRANTVAALTFTTNIFQIITGGSYENTIAPNLFQHTWFLALEMQIYLLAPLVLKSIFAAAKNRKNAVRATGIIFALLAIVSETLLAAYGGLFGQMDRAYFALDSHFGAFCMGGVLAAVNYLVPRTPRSSKPIFIICLLLSLVATAILSFRLEYASVYTYFFGLPVTGLLTVIMLFCIIKLQPNADIRYKPIGLIGLFEYLGSLSFGIYLFHCPLYLLLPNLLPAGTPIWTYALISVVASVAFAIACNRLLGAKQLIDVFKNHKIQRLIYAVLLLVMLMPAALSFMRMPETSGITEQLYEMAEQTPANAESEPVVTYLGLGLLQETISNLLPAQFKVDGAPPPKPPAPPVSPVSNAGSSAGSVSSSKVFILGDSVTLGAKQALESTIPSVYVDAQVSRSISTATSILASYSAREKLPDIIVISLATNHYNITESLLQSIVNTAGSNKTFVLVTAYAGPYQNREPHNATLRNFAAKHSNVVVADWWKVAHNNWSLLAADHIHPNLQGRVAYANVVYNAIRAVAQ